MTYSTDEIIFIGVLVVTLVICSTLAGYFFGKDSQEKKGDSFKDPTHVMKVNNSISLGLWEGLKFGLGLALGMSLFGLIAAVLSVLFGLSLLTSLSTIVL